MIFLRKAKLDTEPMPIKMSGIRMGERLLQIGLDGAALAGAMAAKVGLSGSASLVVADEADAAKARTAAVNAGALLDVRLAPWDALPFEPGVFDAVVVHGMRNWIARLDSSRRAGLFRESRRVLRHGGRVILLEPAPREGLRGLLRPARLDPAYEEAGGSVRALEDAGFKPVRLLGSRGGYRFFEGLKT